MIRNRIRQLSGSEFLKNLGKMMSGAGLAHLLVLLLIPVITRLYTPAEIGVYSTYASMFIILMAVASLRYEFATLVPPNHLAANNITVLAAVVSAGFNLLLLLVLLVFGEGIAAALNIEALGRLIYLLPLSLLSFNGFLILKYSLNYHKKYGAIAGGKVMEASSTGGAQISMGWAGLQEAGLVAGKLIGDVASMLFLLWQRWRMQESVTAGVSPRRMMAMAKRYKSFPLYNMPHALTTASSNNFPVLLFNTYFSEAIAGFYAMAMRACYSPVQIAGQSAYQVFSQRLAEKHGQHDRILPFIRSTTLLMAAIGLAGFLPLFVISPPLFAWALGPEWEVTGQMVRYIIPYIFMVFILRPLNFIPLLTNRQGSAFAIDLVYLLARLAALLTGIYYDDVWLAIGLFSASGVGFSLGLMLWYYRLAQSAESGHSASSS